MFSKMANQIIIPLLLPVFMYMTDFFAHNEIVVE